VQRRFLQLLLFAGVIGSVTYRCAHSASPDFTREVAPLLAKYCTGCHGADEPEGDLSLHTFAALQKGGAHGTLISPGKADESLLLQVLTGKSDITMPPEDSEQPTDGEIATLRAWVDAGAPGPAAGAGA
jgi:hypothetical protein